MVLGSASQDKSALYTRGGIAKYPRQLVALESLLGQIETVAVA
jgi:hypothetical protein